MPRRGPGRDGRASPLADRIVFNRVARSPSGAVAGRIAGIYRGLLLASGRLAATVQVGRSGVLTDPAPITTEVDKFLGCGLDVAAMTGIADPSLYHIKYT
jgi:hypothetical protein